MPFVLHTIEYHNGDASDEDEVAVVGIYSTQEKAFDALLESKLDFINDKINAYGDDQNGLEKYFKADKHGRVSLKKKYRSRENIIKKIFDKIEDWGNFGLAYEIEEMEIK